MQGIKLTIQIPLLNKYHLLYINYHLTDGI
jgi:hypothetical protein